MGLLRCVEPDEVVDGGISSRASVGSAGNWGMWTSSNQAVIGTNVNPYDGPLAIRSDIRSVDNNIGNVQIIQNGFNLRAGYEYTLQFATVCKSARTVLASFADAVGAHTDYFITSVAATTAWALYSSTFVTTVALSGLYLMFQVGSTTIQNNETKLDAISLIPMSPQVTFLPTYGYKRAKNIQRSDHRTIGGGLYTYIEKGNFTQFKVPMTFVNSEQYGLINSWWRSGATLRWAEDDAYPDSYHTVKIVSKEDPFQTFQAPHFQVYYEGEIVMETI